MASFSAFDQTRRTADLIDAGLDPLATEIDAALGAVEDGYFRRRQRTVRVLIASDIVAGAAAGGDPQILRGAGDIQQRRQRRVRRRDLVFKAVQQRLDHPDHLGNAGQEALDRRRIAPAHGQRRARDRSRRERRQAWPPPCRGRRRSPRHR